MSPGFRICLCQAENKINCYEIYVFVENGGRKKCFHMKLGQSTVLAVHFNARNAISDAKIDDLLNGANKKSRGFVQNLWRLT